jgi:hypothetical protein
LRPTAGTMQATAGMGGIFSSLPSRARVGLSGVVQNRDFPRPRAWGIGGNHSMWTCPPVTERGRRRRSEHAESACSAPIRFASWGREVHLAPHGRHYAGDGWDGWDFQQPSLSRARRTVRGRAKSRLYLGRELGGSVAITACGHGARDNLPF